MENIVRLLAVVMVLVGIIYFVKPHYMRKFAYYFIQDKRLKIAGIVSVILGVILLLVASRCKIPWVIVIFGIVVIIKGTVSFIMGKEKLKSIMDQFLIRPSRTLRIYAVTEMALGIILIYSV